MGWAIQHIPGRTENRPYTLVADTLTAAISVLLPRQAAVLNGILNARDAYLELTPQQAAAVRDALHAAARRIRWTPMLRQYLVVIRDIAEAADTAARSGRPWVWS